MGLLNPMDNDENWRQEPGGGTGRHQRLQLVQLLVSTSVWRQKMVCSRKNGAILSRLLQFMTQTNSMSAENGATSTHFSHSFWHVRLLSPPSPSFWYGAWGYYRCCCLDTREVRAVFGVVVFHPTTAFWGFHSMWGCPYSAGLNSAYCRYSAGEIAWRDWNPLRAISG